MPDPDLTITITSPAAIHQYAVDHGWYDDDGHFDSRYFIPSSLAMIHSEISEALEAYRDDEKEGFAEELADAVIRLFDLCAYLEIDIAKAVAAKHAANLERPYKHGGKKV